jgi:hypothetical protein
MQFKFIRVAVQVQIENLAADTVSLTSRTGNMCSLPEPA